MITEQARAAYAEVELKAKMLQDALYKMAEVYDSKFFGIEEFAESIDDALFELDSDMQECEGEECEEEEECE